MNKELKFRAWDGRRMIYHDQRYYGQKAPDKNNRESLAKFFNSFDEDEPIMQYTGLKDKNGKEIYEGDIVMLQTISAPIAFNNGCFGYYIGVFNDFIGLGMNNNFKWENGQSSKIEVVGNIYQNPDLITK